MAEKSVSRSKYTYVRKTFMFQGNRYEVRGRTEAEAYRAMAELQIQLENGECGISQNMRASAWCEEWLNTYVKPRVREPGQQKQKGTMSPNTFAVNESYLRLHIMPALGRLRLQDVRDAHLQRILNNEAGMSFGHVSRIRMLIRGCFSQAAASRIIAFDPSLNLTLPVNTKGSHRSLTDDERKVLYEVAECNPHGLWVRTLLETGIRPGEGAALTVSDIDFKEKLLTVNKAVEAGTKIISSPKTSAGNRLVPIPDSLLPDLQKAVHGLSSSDLVFSQTRSPGAVLTKTCRRRYWESFSRDMDLAMGAEHNIKGHIYDPSDLKPDGSPMYPDPLCPSEPRNGHRIAPDLVPYCLRHTYCTDLQRAGVPLNVARYLMGHSDISVTAQIYTHSGKTDALSAARLINNYMKNEKAEVD